MSLKNGLRNCLVLLLLSGLTVTFMGLWQSSKNRGKYKMGMNDAQTLAYVLFSETKDIEDAKNIANVIINRTKRPERFGSTIEEVIYQPKQFSGVGSNEWNKVVNGKLTDKEADIYKQMIQVAYQAVMGKLEDTTDGADHYFNPKIAQPKWAAKMKKTTENKYHTYYKE